MSKREAGCVEYTELRSVNLRQYIGLEIPSASLPRERIEGADSSFPPSGDRRDAVLKSLDRDDRLRRAYLRRLWHGL